MTEASFGGIGLFGLQLDNEYVSTPHSFTLVLPL